jgi:Uma2 family endonuclease
MAASLPLSRITDEEFDRMIERGLPAVLGRVELRDGFLHRRNAQYVRHAMAKMALFRSLDRSIAAAKCGLHIASEVSVRFGDGFTPLPDIVVWAPTPVRGCAPGDTVRLIVEIADTTQKDDFGPKLEAYAQAGLAECWVVDLPARSLHRFAGVEGGRYRQTDVFPERALIASLAIPGIAAMFTTE